MSVVEALFKETQRTEVRPGRHVVVRYHRNSSHEEKTIFLCHGAGGRSHQYRLIIDELANKGYSICTWDAVGHGDSDKPNDSYAYTTNELVSDMEVIFNKYKSKINMFIAHSYGTALTLHLLKRLKDQGASDLVSKVVLLASSAQRPHFHPVFYLPVMALEWIRPMFAKPFRVKAWHPETSEELVNYEGALGATNPMFVVGYVMKNLLWWMNYLTPEEVKSLSTPILLLSGKLDGITTSASAEVLSKSIENLHAHVILEKAAHQLMLEQPDLVLKHTLSFFDK